jgi:transposase
MMADMTTQIEFTSEIRETLNYERYHHPVPLVQRRMEVLWLKSHDLPHALIAKLAGVSENTIRDYFELFLAGGLEKLKEVHFYRPESELVPYAHSLEEYFRLNPPATIKEAQSEIETLTGIKRSETQVAEFLKKTPSALPQGRYDSRESRSR